jgi:8-amino-7-oxononanoate synthase
MPADPLAWIDKSLTSLAKTGLRRQLSTRQGPQRADHVVLDGQTLINFGSNDYLGLAAAELSAAAIDGIRRHGWGSGASPLISGRGALHAELEQRLAEFEGTQAALLFPTGFAANLGTIGALVGSRDTVLCDAKNHASIIDGCRLSGAHLQTYPHGDVDQLRNLLAASGEFRRRLIVTDSLFSMDGDLAPLADLAELAERYEAMLMVDEAHATGVFGARGRGVCEHSDVEDGVHVRVGTLSKALGSVGGFVAGQRRLIDWLSNRARPYVYSTAPPPATAAAALAALQVVQREPERRISLLDRANRLRADLEREGWSTGNSASQIVPIYIGNAQATMRMAAALRARGFLVPGIRPPTVPHGQSLLRISLCSNHGDPLIQSLLEALAACANQEGARVPRRL